MAYPIPKQAIPKLITDISPKTSMVQPSFLNQEGHRTLRRGPAATVLPRPVTPKFIVVHNFPKINTISSKFSISLLAWLIDYSTPINPIDLASPRIEGILSLLSIITFNFNTISNLTNSAMSSF